VFDHDYNLAICKFAADPKAISYGKGVFSTLNATCYYPKAVDITGFKPGLILHPTHIPCDPIPLPYDDVPLDHWAYKDICGAYTAGVIDAADPSGQFGPGALTTRYEFIKWVVKGFGLKPSGDADPPFADYASVPADLRPYVMAAWQNGVLNGSASGDGKTYIDGEALMSREQYTAMLVRAALGKDADKALADMAGAGRLSAPGFTDGGISPWAADYIAYARTEGIVKGDASGRFNPQNRVTRAESVAMLMRSLAR